jgi:PKD repeat protein
MEKKYVYLILIIFVILYLILNKYNDKYNDKYNNINYDNYVIVCAKYKKNTDFLKEIPIKSIVITKNIDVTNKANEASSYLHYIIMNYINLPENIIFIHDEDSSWHHEGKISENIYKWIDEYEKKGSTYYEFNNIIYDKNTELKLKHKNIYHMFIKYWNYIFDLPITDFENTKSSKYVCCAQFIVSKNVIKKRPLSFYKKIYNWIYLNSDDNGKITHVNNPNSGYSMGLYLEWTWYNIFNP